MSSGDTKTKTSKPGPKPLKQATLPFLVGEKAKKRKINCDSDEIKVLKVVLVKETGPLYNKTAAAAVENENVSEKEAEKSKKQKVVCENEELEKKSSDAIDTTVESENSTDEQDLDSSTEINKSTAISELLDGDDKESVISLSDIPITPMKTPGVKKPRKLTPKQLQKHEEMLARKAEKEREKEERERKRIEEKENKKKQKEEKEELKKREKIEREQKRQADIDKKNEEKRQKEEDRKRKEEEKAEEKRQKEEEKRRKEEEKIQKEEEKKKQEIEEQKKQEKAKAAFASFFKKNETKNNHNNENHVVVGNFMPFEVKADMKLAPTVRSKIKSSNRKLLDDIMNGEKIKHDASYLKVIKRKDYKRGRQGKTWPVNNDKECDDVIIIDEEQAGEAIQINNKKQTVKATLLQFHENRRPPYWGTWRKKSAIVTARRPFAKDIVFSDYEVDSDDEWEEEEPGESIKGSDDEQEKESDDEYEVDNEVFVPHGYLSDEEIGQDEAIPPEAQKERLKLLEKEFNAEMSKKQQQLKPRIIGIFLLNNLQSNDPVYNQLLNVMKPYTALKVQQEIPTSFNRPNTPDDTSVKRNNKTRVFPEEAVTPLIRLIHGNTKSKTFLSKEFVSYWENEKKKDDDRKLSRALVSRKMKEIASWQTCADEGPIKGKMCWYVTPEVREAHGLSSLPLPNDWQYTIPLRETPKVENTNETRKNSNSIKKFTKTLSEAERQKLNQIPLKRKSDHLSPGDKNPTMKKIKRKSSTPIQKAPKCSPVLNSTPKQSQPLVKDSQLITTTPKQEPVIKKPEDSPVLTTTPKQQTTINSPFSPSSAFHVSPHTCQEKKGRRVSLLVSVPRGQEIPVEALNSALTSANQFQQKECNKPN